MTDRPRPHRGPDHQHDHIDEPDRVAVISLHTSPRDQPGSGDSGGMNVYVVEVARRLAQQGIEVDIFTRCHGQGGPEVEEIAPGARLMQVQAGPCAPVRKDELPELLPQFLGGVLQRAVAEGENHRHSPYDVVHSHYWLSGWVGSRAKEIWGAPLVASFHTLGKVKNAVLPRGDPPEPPARLAGEEGVVRGADRILVPPGVDGSVFSPRSKQQARARLHLSRTRLLLFVGRLQPFKGPDVAIRAVAEAVARSPELTRDLMLAVVGGSTGLEADRDEVTRLMRLAAEIGVADRVMFFPPQPHDRLADFYAAAEAVLMPSRSESFGLVALEAQACGTPVIAAATGGLRQVVVDGQTGYLVPGHDPAQYTERILLLLGNRESTRRLGARAARHAAGFSWDATAAEILNVYQELLPEPAT
jgi:D-inositol-3-phosphate glycosyltransferase